MDLTALYALSYGVYVVSAVDSDKGRFSGCVVNSVMQITSSPATVALSVSRDNYTNELIKNGGRFAVSVLAESVDPSLIARFGFASGRDTAKFDGVEHTELGGLPVLPGACAAFVCTVTDVKETATHTVFLASVDDTETLSAEPPMTYAYYHRVIKGRAPKNAPTYVEEKPVEQKRYVCKICGFVYCGETPFEQLPDDYVCPICGAPKSAFELR